MIASLADLLVTHRHKPETRLVDITVTYSYPNVAKHSSSNTIGGRGTAAKAAEEVKDAYNKRAIIPAGTLVPVAFETYGTLGARGDAYLRDVVRNYVRPAGDVARRTCGQGSQVRRPRWALLHLPAETP